MALVFGIFSFLMGSASCKEDDDGKPPVEFTWLGITADHKLHYRLKINTNRQIDQVNLKLRYKTANGWEPEVGMGWIPNDGAGHNEIPSKGQVYDVLDPVDVLDPPVIDAEMRLDRVMFHGKGEHKRSF